MCSVKLYFCYVLNYIYLLGICFWFDKLIFACFFYILFFQLKRRDPLKFLAGIFNNRFLEFNLGHTWVEGTGPPGPRTEIL